MRQPKEHTVLYVDDERANLRGFKSAFRRLYNVYVAEHPSIGMELVKEHDIDIVVSDHRMPDLIGTDFLREVKKHNPDIRRIILSGFISQEELQAANQEYGIHAYVSKPWDFDHVQGIFQNLLNTEDPPSLSF